MRKETLNRMRKLLKEVKKNESLIMAYHNRPTFTINSRRSTLPSDLREAIQAWPVPSNPSKVAVLAVFRNSCVTDDGPTNDSVKRPGQQADA